MEKETDTYTKSLTNPEFMPDDEIEKTLRPKTFSEFTGQKKIVDFISDQEYFDSKELRDLGWEPEPIDTALRKTLESL